MAAPSPGASTSATRSTAPHQHHEFRKVRDRACGLPRTPLLGTWVNKGKKKGRGVLPQAPPARKWREPAYLPSSAHCPNICPAVSTDVTGWASILEVS